MPPHGGRSETIKLDAKPRNHGGRREGAGRKPKQAIQRRLLGPRWHVLQLAIPHEARAIRDVAEGETRPGRPYRPGYQTALPMIAAIVSRRGRREPGQIPMFRGYGFVRFDAAHDDWARLAYCDDVIRLLTTRSLKPVPVRAGLVELLLETAAERLQLRDGAMPARPLGTVLRVAAGPMAGVYGPCVGCDGVNSTIEVPMFLDRAVPLTLPWASFEAAEG